MIRLNNHHWVTLNSNIYVHVKTNPISGTFTFTDPDGVATITAYDLPADSVCIFYLYYSNSYPGMYWPDAFIISKSPLPNPMSYTTTGLTSQREDTWGTYQYNGILYYWMNIDFSGYYGSVVYNWPVHRTSDLSDVQDYIETGNASIQTDAVPQTSQKKVIKVYVGNTQVYPDTIRMIRIYFSRTHTGSYQSGDVFSISDFQITGEYNDGHEVVIQNTDQGLQYSIADGTQITTGMESTLIATYNGTDTAGKTLQAECMLDVPDGRYIDYSKIYGLQYAPDDSFDLSDYEVKFYNPDGSSTTVTDDCTFNIPDGYIFTGDDPSSLVATFAHNGKTYTVDTPINMIQTDEYGRYIRITSRPINQLLEYGTIITRGSNPTFTVTYNNENGQKSVVNANCTHIYTGEKEKDFNERLYGIGFDTSNNNYIVNSGAKTYTVRYDTGNGVLEASITLDIMYQCFLNANDAGAELARQFNSGNNPCYIPIPENYNMVYSPRDVYRNSAIADQPRMSTESKDADGNLLTPYGGLYGGHGYYMKFMFM